MHKISLSNKGMPSCAVSIAWPFLRSKVATRRRNIEQEVRDSLRYPLNCTSRGALVVPYSREPFTTSDLGCQGPVNVGCRREAGPHPVALAGVTLMHSLRD